MEGLEFKECPTCAEKPGSPILCESCLHNRWVIDRWKEINYDLELKLEKILTVIGYIK